MRINRPSHIRPAQSASPSARRCWSLILLLSGGLLLALIQVRFNASTASAFAAPAFQTQWQRGEAMTPNFWGPLSLAHDGQQESYNEAPGGKRLVQYFDKGRMELTNGVVTDGLLATELISGRLQAGNTIFQPITAAAIPVAGDPDNPGPTYAQIGSSGFTTAAASAVGSPTVRALSRVDAAGTFAAGGSDASATIGAFDATTQHNVPKAFADYRSKAGLPTIGLAIAEPFWANGVLVGGQPKDVLVQAFERRVLTYTPSNPDAFKVEMGNIGAHYYQWRYATDAGTATDTGKSQNPAAAGTVFVIMLENRERANALAAMPYLATLAGENAQLSDMFAITHPSLPNRLAITTGDTHGVADDTIRVIDTDSIFDHLEAVGGTWGWYIEGMSKPCSLSGTPLYPDYHNTPLQIASVRNDAARCQSHDVPLSQFARDLANEPKALMWIEPDQINSGHNTDAATADAWLRSFVPQILASTAYQNGGKLIITFDEGETNAGCCDGVAAGGNIAFIAVSPDGPHGLIDTRTLSMYSFERTLGDLLGFTVPGKGAAAPTMTNLFVRDLNTAQVQK